MRSRLPVSGLLLLISINALLAAAPPNDNFNGAITLTGTNLTISATNVGATKEIGEPNHAGDPGGRSVWWEWTAPGPGSVFIRTTGSSFDTLLAVYTGSSVAELSDTLAASNDDAGKAVTSLVAFNVTAGTTYHIVVDGFGGASGDIQLALSYRVNILPDPPLNDNFANRIPLQGMTVTAMGTSYFATKEPAEPAHAEELGGASVWWSWTAPASGHVVIDTQGSDFDTLLGVYIGSALTNLVTVASNDDVSTNQLTSSVTFTAKAGTPYQIAVDGFDGEPGDIQLNIAMQNVVWLDTPKQVPAGGYKLSLTGVVGKQYTFQASTDLMKWQTLVTLPNPTGIIEFTDNPAMGMRFYRALQGP
jgi:hypothetical protein